MFEVASHLFWQGIAVVAWQWFAVAAFAVCQMPQLPLGFLFPFINEVVRFEGQNLQKKRKRRKTRKEMGKEEGETQLLCYTSCGLSWFWKLPFHELLKCERRTYFIRALRYFSHVFPFICMWEQFLNEKLNSVGLSGKTKISVHYLVC